MNYFKKALAAMLVALAINQGAQAQGANDAMFHSLGWSIYTDYMRSPVFTGSYTAVDSYTGVKTTYSTFYQHEGINIATFMYNFRYNLFEPSNDMAISASAIPALGASVSGSTGYHPGLTDAGFGSFNIPILAGIEFGAGSTYNSTSNMGGFFRIGYEFTLMPLFGGSEEDAYSSYTDVSSVKKSWGEAVIQGGVRYWNKNNKLREIHIKYGFGTSVPDEATAAAIDPNNPNSSYYSGLGSGMSIRLSWLLFLNY